MPPIVKAAELAGEALAHLAPGSVENGLNLLKVVGEKTGLAKFVPIEKTLDGFESLGQKHYHMELTRPKSSSIFPDPEKTGFKYSLMDEYSGSTPDHSFVPKRVDEDLPSLEYVKKRLAEIKTNMANTELPVSTITHPSTWKFIPENATELDAYDLKVEGPADALAGSTERGDGVLKIKRYVNTEGQPAHEYLSGIIKNNDVTIVGEQHTKMDPNPHRLLGAKVVSELPPGSTLAVELPSSLKPIFEEFNNAHGSDLQISPLADSMLSMQPALSLLRSIKSESPDLIDLWKAARDRGVRVVPVDAEVSESVTLTDESRESKIADEILALSNNTTKPVVAWYGGIHGARTTEGGVPLLAKRIAESPRFASGERRLSTVLSQLSDVESEPFPLSALARNVREPVGIPARLAGEEGPLDKVKILGDAVSDAVKTDASVAHYDHLILYPPTADEALAAHYMGRADALMGELTRGVKKGSGSASPFDYDLDPDLENNFDFFAFSKYSDDVQSPSMSSKEDALTNYFKKSSKWD